MEVAFNLRCMGGYQKVPRELNRNHLRKGFDLTGGVTCKKCFEKELELDRLRQEVKDLKQKLSYQTKRNLTQGAFGNNTAPSQRPIKKNSLEENKKKKGGAKPGHKGRGRKKITKDKADEVRDVPAPKLCPDCHIGLNSCDTVDRGVIDIEPVKPKKILYRCKRGRCPECFKTFTNKPAGVLPNSLYGNELLSQAASLHYLEGVPIGRIISVFGGSITEGALIQAFHRIARFFEPIMPQLVSDYKSSWVKHADETGWRTDGQKGYCWLYCSESTTIFQHGENRSAAVAHKVFGSEALNGFLVVDRYNGYNQIRCKIQYCFSHLLREVESLEEEFDENSEVKTFATKAGLLIADAIKLGKREITDDEYYTVAKKLKAQIQEVMSAKVEHMGIRRIQEIFQNNEKRLYHWVDDRHVPSHNNRAERELRPTVVARKTSFGSQSEKGAKTRSTLTSILCTVKKRVKDQSPQSWLKEALDWIAKNGQEGLRSQFPPPITFH